ncbi:hypothetical protein BJX66DRAFT_332751 [Aspergillus keveii]|uniref:Uncharacterized protein n=1 Tax=Aspergillus keveii TaxID=714993 RepID=A0ABR4GKV4_9EURO
MTHQVHNIPWTLLSSHLKYSRANQCSCGITNLHPRMQPNQGKEITFFINAFIRNIKEHSTCERKKHPAHYEPPSDDEIIIDERTAKRIAPTIRRVKTHLNWENIGRSSDVLEDRTVKLFLTKYRHTPCYKFLYFQRQGFLNLQVVATLLLYGEMETILRGCAHPDVAIEGWLDATECQCGNELGWELVYEKALTAYICLNLLYCFPETWDSASSSSSFSTGDEMKDYRDTKLYQYTVRTCTGKHKSADLVTYPHRQFFGIPDDHWGSAGVYVNNKQHWLRWSPHTSKYGFTSENPGLYGLVPLREFLSLERPAEDEISYQPFGSDAALVRGLLYQKGLPIELAWDIMDLAGYEPTRRLRIEHDPLHPENREALSKYLTYCWQIIVRCDMMAREIGMEIPWQEVVSKCLVRMLDSKGCRHEKRWYKAEWDDDGGIRSPVFS